MRKTLQYFISVLCVLCVYTALRWVNIERRLTFGWDQEQFSNQVYALLADHKISLLGPRVLGDTGFFLGPYFTFVLAPFYALTRLHPAALLYFVLFYTLVFFVTSLFVVKRIFGFRMALFLLFFWAINPLLAVYDITPWNPIFMPLGTVIVWYLLFLIYKKNRLKEWIMLGLTLAFFTNMHFQFVFMVFYAFVFLGLTFSQKKYSFKHVVLSVIAFVSVFAPLIVFDLRHNFLNTNLLTKFFAQGLDSVPPDRHVWKTVFTNFLKPVLFASNEYVMLGFYALIVILSLYLIFCKKDFFRQFYKSFLSAWLLFPLLFMLYGKRPSEYYFVFLYPFIYIILIDLFLTKKLAVPLAIAGIILFAANGTLLRNNFNPELYGLYYKDRAVMKLKELTKERKFNVSFSVPVGAHTGYDYLMKWHGIKQSGDWSDPLVQIHIPPAETDIRVGEIGIILPKDF